MITYRQLGKVEAVSASLFIDPTQWGLSLLDKEWIAFAAFDKELPVGMLAAGWDPILAYAHLISLSVLPEKRGQGIARELLTLFEKWVFQKMGCLITLIYPLNVASTTSYAAHLLQKGWQGPRPYKIVCHFDKTFNPDWLHRLPSLPKGVEEFPWRELSLQEKEMILERVASSRIPNEISPFHQEHEPINSLGLRSNGCVIGWLITCRQDAQTIRYSAFYLDPAYQSLGLAARLLGDAILLDLQSEVNHEVCEINLLDASPSWVRFVTKRLIPYATMTYYFFQIWHTPNHNIGSG